MKCKFTLFTILLFVSAVAFSQAKQPSGITSSKKSTFSKTKASDITGIWRGYFAQNSFGVFDDRYKFEVQVEQKPSSAISGVTYSYKTTVFYGKATLQGIYFKSTKTVVINELKLIELKIEGESQPCLMKCDLEYSKMGNLETLTGTYTSRNMKDKDDCGSGKVYLEKTTTSDFYKEDFLVKREKGKKSQPLAKTQPSSGSSAISKPKMPTPPPANTTVKTTPKIKPGAEGSLITKKADTPLVTTAPVAPPVKEDVAKAKSLDKPFPKPEVMKQRNNELIKTFYTSAKEIKIELYDNGEIDGDTITVYHNNQLIVSKKRLTDKPITFTIKADEKSPHHEFVLVAENLGSIPPNTALMIITAGTHRYETFVTSTEQKNAVVDLEYQPDAP